MEFFPVSTKSFLHFRTLCKKFKSYGISLCFLPISWYTDTTHIIQKIPYALISCLWAKEKFPRKGVDTFMIKLESAGVRWQNGAPVPAPTLEEIEAVGLDENGRAKPGLETLDAFLDLMGWPKA